MKNLLVPTDFSATADNAIDYAIHLANALGFNLILLHSIQVHKKTGILISLEDLLEAEAIESMKPLEAKVKGALKPGLEVRTLIVKGRVTTAIAEIAEKKRVEYIVMGTEGASGLKEFLTGSKTGKLVHETGIPVLAVPTTCNYKPLKKIALALDSKKLAYPDAFVPLLTFAKILEAKILVYHFETNREDAGMDPDIGEILKDVEHSFHYDLVGKNINDALDDFVKDYGVDLICMLKRKRDLWSELFHESATDEELHHAHLPVLVIKE